MTYICSKKKKANDPIFSENQIHHWIKYEGEWLRFTETQIETAKRIAKNNKSETPTLLERLKDWLSK